MLIINTACENTTKEPEKTSDEDKKQSNKSKSNEVDKKTKKKSSELKKNYKDQKQENYKKVSFDKNKPFAHLEKDDYTIENEDELIAELPEALQESIRKYPETKNEILKFNEWKKNPQSYDISGQYKKGEIPRFIQWDSRWGFQPMGNLYIAYAGCGPTALSSAYIYFTGDTDMNPVKMCNWAEEQGYYADGYGSNWSLWDQGAPSLGINSTSIAFNLENVKNELDQGNLIILNVGPGDFTTGGHYVMLIGYEDDKLIIHDVNSPRNSEKKWDIERIAPQVKNAWALSM